MKRLAIVALGALVAASAFGQELTVNGGFEAGTTTPPAGWSGTVGSISGINGGGGSAHSGTNWYDMGATSATGQTDLFQDIATTVGTTYTASVWAFNEDPTSGGGFTATFGTASIANYGMLTNAYAQYSVNFTATAATTRLEFTGWELNQWVIVDDFSVRAQSAPEPASMAALGLGALVLIRGRRNRKN